MAVVAYLKDYFAKGDFDAMAAEIFKAYKKVPVRKKVKPGTCFGRAENRKHNKGAYGRG